MNLYQFFLVIVSLISLILAFFLLIQKEKKPSTNYFILYSLMIFYSTSLEFFFLIAESYLEAFILLKARFLFPFTLSFLFIFTLSFTNKKQLILSPWAILFVHFPAFFLSIGWVIDNNLSGIPKRGYWGWENSFSGINLTWIILVSWFTLIGLVILFFLCRYYLELSKGEKKQQTKFILMGISIPYFISIISDGLFSYLLKVQLRSYESVFALSTIPITYAIIKYQLFRLTPITASDDILTTISDAIFLVNNKYRIIYTNEIAQNLLEYTKDEINGSSFDIIFTNNFKQNFNTKSFLLDLSHQLKNDRIELFLVQKTGSIVPVSFSVRVLRKKNSEIKGYVCTASDISVLRKSEEKYSSILENITDGYYEVDLSGNFTYFNDTACQFLGYQREEMEGLNYKKFMDQETSKRVYKYFNDAFRSKNSPITFECEMIRKDKKHRFANVTMFLMFQNDGRIIGFRGIFRDITERKKIEQERVKAEKIRTELEIHQKNFIAMTSHELRTPLTSIRGYTDLLEKHFTNLDEKRIKMSLDVIRKNISRLERIVKGIADLTLIRQNKFDIKRDPFCIVSFLENSINEYKNLLGDQFKYEIKINRTTTINGDSDRLRQVLDNLISNAMKNSSRILRKIVLSATELSENIRIQVSDNGAGIASENLERIFEQFVSIPTEYSVGSSGIGLYISKIIVEGHDGHIFATSGGIGKGATFVLELPKN